MPISPYPNILKSSYMRRLQSQKEYYHPDMKGSYSIKDVLPVLVPDLSYKELPIKEGGMAMKAFEQLLTETNQKIIRQLRNSLLTYCEMDAMATFRLIDKLMKL